MKNNDAEIQCLLASNEAKAFRLIFDRYYTSLCGIALLYVPDPDEAEDIVQQLLIRMWEEKHIHQVTSSLKSYLRKSVRNNCINYLEKQKTLSTRLQFLPDEEQAAQALDFLLDKEERSLFEKAVEELPGQSRKALELVYFSGQSYKSAAGTLNLSVNTLKSHLKNALRLLKHNAEIKNYFSEKNRI